MQTEDTIAAISTAAGHSGIGIIRLSGRDALKISDRIFRSAKKKKIGKTPSHRILYGHIIDPVTKETIDEVLVSVMKAPNTYTKEDVVEINSHGGPVPLRRILEIVLNQGARFAAPGEFTQRAFLNGRLDLAQAEAVLDIINALTEQSQKTAVAQLRGGLSKKIGSIREELIELAAFVEAHIDFPEEDIGALSREDMKKRALNIQKALQKLIESSRYGMVLREGLKTAIIGRPNVGKSSLLNALLQHDRAIVTESPGTTRDVIEEYLNIKGIPVRVMDTAGIRDVKDIAEKEGVKRSLRAMEDADLVLLVLDGSEELHETDKELIGKSLYKRRIIVINKSDLPQKINPPSSPFPKGGDVVPLFDKEAGLPLPQSIATGSGEILVLVSAKKETGLDELKNRIAETVLTGSGGGSAEVVTNMRHVNALEKALVSIDSFVTAVDKETSPEFLSVELRDALDAVGDIIGVATPDEILNRIFSNFCIGK
ncbi:MAG: tRNA uridine-5-carboxymethylaminomethyl(34) synthesis GTPase MnmE [Nitrospirota bacterium]